MHQHSHRSQVYKAEDPARQPEPGGRRRAPKISCALAFPRGSFIRPPRRLNFRFLQLSWERNQPCFNGCSCCPESSRACAQGGGGGTLAWTLTMSWMFAEQGLDGHHMSFPSPGISGSVSPAPLQNCSPPPNSPWTPIALVLELCLVSPSRRQDGASLRSASLGHA